MKTKSKITVLFILLLSVFFVGAQAQPPKAKVKTYLNRTNAVIHHAKNVVKTGKVYTGDLVKAVEHQKFAKKMFLAGDLKKAMNHSHRARMFAHKAIAANKGKLPEKMKSNKNEQALEKEVVDNDELDADVPIPQGVTDQTVVDEKIDDLK